MSTARQTKPIKSRCRVVVFDLGGVLVRICRSWKEACGYAGVPFYDLLADPANIAQRKAVVRQHEIGLMSDQEYFERIAATTNGLYTPQQVMLVHHHWTLGEYPGVKQLIDDLHALGLRTGVLSNTNNYHWGTLTARHNDGTPTHPALASVHHLHASHTLGHAKPDPAIYHAFCEASGCVPDEVVFFDDLADNIDGAASAGWDAAQIDHAGDTASQMRLHLRLRDVNA